MTTITMRHTKGTFLVTGKDIEARKFGSRREAKDWCAGHYPGSPIKEIGRGAAKAPTRKPGLHQGLNSAALSRSRSLSQRPR
jgi:hypothetical protein